LPIFDGGSAVGALGAGVLSASFTKLAALNFAQDASAFIGGFVGRIFALALSTLSQLCFLRADFTVIRVGYYISSPGLIPK
jgi:uncharacterized membrane protein YjjP (DUF1212 family)